jgi:hypothetical protein
MNEVTERIERFLNDWPSAEFGPGHIVFGDYNLETHHIDYCLKETEADNETDPDELRATIAFLRELRDIPEERRCKGLDDDTDFT